MISLGGAGELSGHPLDPFAAAQAMLLCFQVGWPQIGDAILKGLPFCFCTSFSTLFSSSLFWGLVSCISYATLLYFEVFCPQFGGEKEVLVAMYGRSRMTIDPPNRGRRE